MNSTTANQTEPKEASRGYTERGETPTRTKFLSPYVSVSLISPAVSQGQKNRDGGMSERDSETERPSQGTDREGKFWRVISRRAITKRKDNAEGAINGRIPK